MAVGGTFNSFEAAAKAIQRDLARLPQQLSNDVADEVEKQLLTEVKVHTPVRTGRLQRGWKRIPGAPSQVAIDGSRPIVGNPVSYGPPVDARGRGIVKPALVALRAKASQTLRRVVRKRGG